MPYDRIVFRDRLQAHSDRVLDKRLKDVYMTKAAALVFGKKRVDYIQIYVYTCFSFKSKTLMKLHSVGCEFG